jgi:hypothetical protein
MIEDSYPLCERMVLVMRAWRLWRAKSVGNASLCCPAGSGMRAVTTCGGCLSRRRSTVRRINSSLDQCLHRSLNLTVPSNLHIDFFPRCGCALRVATILLYLSIKHLQVLLSGHLALMHVSWPIEALSDSGL